MTVGLLGLVTASPFIPLIQSPVAARGGQSHFRGENACWRGNVFRAAKIGTVPCVPSSLILHPSSFILPPYTNPHRFRRYHSNPNKPTSVKNIDQVSQKVFLVSCCTSRY
jgi:hypothetical protein